MQETQEIQTQTIPHYPACEGCGNPMDPMGYFGGYKVCWACTKARHRAVLAKKCCCGTKNRRPRLIATACRTWWGCDRCLGAIRALKQAN